MASINPSPVYEPNVPVVTLFSQSKNAATARITSIWKTSVQGSHQIYKALAVILVRIYDAGCALSDSIQYMIAKIYAYVLNALGLTSKEGLHTLRLLFQKYQQEFQTRVLLSKDDPNLSLTVAVRKDATRPGKGIIHIDQVAFESQNPAQLFGQIKQKLEAYYNTPETIDDAFDNLTNLLSQATALDVLVQLYSRSHLPPFSYIIQPADIERWLNATIRTTKGGVELITSYDFRYISDDSVKGVGHPLGTQKASRTFFIPWQDLGRNWSGTPLELIAPGTTVHDDFGPFLQS